MATQINISKVDFTNTAVSGQIFSFDYKLFSASAWISAATNKTVNAGGTLAVPFSISGLTAGQLYYVRSSNNCTPTKYYIQQFQL